MTPRRYYSMQPPPFAPYAAAVLRRPRPLAPLLPAALSTSALPLPGPTGLRCLLSSPFSVRARSSLSYPLSSRFLLALVTICVHSLDLLIQDGSSLALISYLSLFFKSTIADASAGVMLHDAPSPSLRALLGVRRRRGLPKPPLVGGSRETRGRSEARTGAVRRGARRRIRSIPTTERRHRESLLRNGAKHPLVIPHSSRGSCVQDSSRRRRA